jgi:hypothetical protein
MNKAMKLDIHVHLVEPKNKRKNIFSTVFLSYQNQNKRKSSPYCLEYREIGGGGVSLFISGEFSKAYKKS